jgi:chemotaxis regulatin CheY-phosphate phosphatase CheZ
MPYQRLARHVLDEWRLLERKLARIDPASPEAEQLMAEAHALREEYQHLIDEAAAHHRPEPPPFPKA